MVHGKKFIEENLNYAVLFERLFKKRELDQWYKEICQSLCHPISEFIIHKDIEEVKINNRNWPSYRVQIKLKNIKGEQNFVLEQILDVRISKIIPVFELNCSHTLNHDLIDGPMQLWGPPQSDSLNEIMDQFREKFTSLGYTELSDRYDLHDTVYEWDELQGIDFVNRRLVLEDAVFVDILELCQ